MPAFATKRLQDKVDSIAPDGFAVRLLVEDARAGLAHFQLAAGQTGRAGAHHTVTELWYILEGQGEMWRRSGAQEEIVRLEPGTSVTILAGTRFQSRAIGPEPLSAIGVTIPPWPGGEEWYPVEGKWEATVGG